MTSALRGLLQDANVIKVGVAAGQDAQKVARDFGFSPACVLDASDMAQRVLQPPGRWSLAALVARLLHCSLPKPGRVRVGAWDARQLSAAQVEYAALDAFASLRVWQELSIMPLLPVLAPKLPVVPLGAAPAAGEQADGGAHASSPPCLLVPAVASPAALQHTKQEALSLHLSGMRIQQIAEARGIKESTAANYLADAMVAGHAYRWDLLDVTPSMMDLVSGALAAAPPPEEALPPGTDTDAALRSRMKQLRPLLPESITFSHLRLALVHRQRLAML
jgi:hypothetical protein